MTGLSSTFTQPLYEHNILIGSMQPVSTTTPLVRPRHWHSHLISTASLVRYSLAVNAISSVTSLAY